MQNEDVLAVRRRTDALITAETQQQAVANQTANYTFLKIVICLFFVQFFLWCGSATF